MMVCPCCETEDLEQINPGIDNIMNAFIAIEYYCPRCGEITMFFNYDRTETASGTILSENKPKELLTGEKLREMLDEYEFWGRVAHGLATGDYTESQIIRSGIFTELKKRIR